MTFGVHAFYIYTLNIHSLYIMYEMHTWLIAPLVAMGVKVDNVHKHTHKIMYLF